MGRPREREEDRRGAHALCLQGSWPHRLGHSFPSMLSRLPGSRVRGHPSDLTPRVGRCGVTAGHSRTSPSGHWGGGQSGGAWVSSYSELGWLPPKVEDELDSPNSPNAVGAGRQASLTGRWTAGGGVLGRWRGLCTRRLPGELCHGFFWGDVLFCPGLKSPPSAPWHPSPGACPTVHARERMMGAGGTGRAPLWARQDRKGEEEGGVK